MTNIADQLTAARKRRNLTLKQVSDTTGLTVGFLSDIENGRGNATIKTLETLADFYGMTWELTPRDTDADRLRKRMFADAVDAWKAGLDSAALGNLLNIVGDVIGYKVETDGVR
jgi:transcriptional regulator with XRE-family HTH domain